MTKLLYWMVYHFDLGPLGPRVLDLAVQSWLSHARSKSPFKALLAFYGTASP
jgi:hypothetical protein